MLYLARALIVVLIFSLLGCGARSGDSANPDETPVPGETADLPAVPALAVLDDVDLVDLTYSYNENTLYWPTSPSDFRLDELAYGDTAGGYFYAANAFCTPEHGGTHLDAPIHFAADKHTTDQVPLSRLIGPAVVIDVSTQAAADADYRMTAEDVLAWEAQHGPVPAGAIVLMNSGWGERWTDRLAYFGDDTPGEASNLHFPSFGKSAAELLIRDRKIAVLGVDTASIDHGPSTDFVVHRLAGAANVPGLENVANLGRVPASGAWVIALPIKIAGGSGGPVRIVALVPRS